MMEKVNALPPFQRNTAYDAYTGLRVCWLGIFDRVFEEPKYEKTSKKKSKLKWIVSLKYYDSSSLNPYYPYTIHCYGISLEIYPQLKFMHDDELVIVSGTVARFGYTTELRDAKLEFTGRRIEKRY
jgi:hypothetical protein